jgi:hypothetical protein
VGANSPLRVGLAIGKGVRGMFSTNAVLKNVFANCRNLINQTVLAENEK